MISRTHLFPLDNPCLDVQQQDRLTVSYLSREGREEMDFEERCGSTFSLRVQRFVLLLKASTAVRGRASRLMHKDATFQLHQAQSLLIYPLAKMKFLFTITGLGADPDESLEELRCKASFPLWSMMWLLFSKLPFSSYTSTSQDKATIPYTYPQTLCLAAFSLLHYFSP